MPEAITDHGYRRAAWFAFFQDKRATNAAGARVSETLLKFDGSRYKPASCWLTDQSKDGTRHRVPCGGD
ncbi:MAG TPA: hypothetical protein VK582_04045 [Pyrinomonadaceae bacterium]|nr:hypothetical protein [Pyrinomonadaceae bacterium]